MKWNLIWNIFLYRLFIIEQLINYPSLCYFCEIVGHFVFYPPKNPHMNIQSKQILCGQFGPYTRPWYKNILVRNLF